MNEEALTTLDRLRRKKASKERNEKGGKWEEGKMAFVKR
jgi:hypothetical protein